MSATKLVTMLGATFLSAAVGSAGIDDAARQTQKPKTPPAPAAVFPAEPVTVPPAAPAPAAVFPAEPATVPPAVPAPQAAGAADKAEDLAQAAGESWLKLTDAGGGGASWEQGSKLLKAAYTKEAWTQLGDRALASLGKVVSRKVTSRRFSERPEGAPDGKYMTLQYETAFQKKTSAAETVILTLEPDGVWRVMGYVIN